MVWVARGAMGTPRWPSRGSSGIGRRGFSSETRRELVKEYAHQARAVLGGQEGFQPLRHR
jgi:hypothetical protein